MATKYVRVCSHDYTECIKNIDRWKDSVVMDTQEWLADLVKRREKYVRSALVVINRPIYDEDLLDDLSQNVWRQVCSNPAHYRFLPISESTWLYSCARGVSNNHWHLSHTRQTFVEASGDLYNQGEGLTGMIGTLETIEALNRLPTAKVQTGRLLADLLAGYNQSEAAKRQDVSTGTIEKHLVRIRQMYEFIQAEDSSY